MDHQQLCELLKDAGVVEVILEVVNENPEIEFNGRDLNGDYFKLTFTNASFAEHGL